MKNFFARKESNRIQEVASYDPVFKALRVMKASANLEGTIFIHESIILDANTGLAENQQAQFIREVNTLVKQYQTNERHLSRALFGFDAGAVLILQCTPYILCLLFRRIEDATSIEEAGEKFLKEWKHYLKVTDRKRITLDKINITDILSKQNLDTSEKNSKLKSNNTTVSERVKSASENLEITTNTPNKGDDLKESSSEETRTKKILSFQINQKSHKTVSSQPEKEQKDNQTLETSSALPHAEATSLSEKKSETIKNTLSQNSTETMNLANSNDPGDSWKSFRQKLENLLSKVLGRAQTGRIISRELTAIGINSDGYLLPPQFRPFGLKLLQKVKDKSLRGQLEKELILLVEKHQQ